MNDIETASINNTHVLFFGEVLEVSEGSAFCFLSVKMGQSHLNWKDHYVDIYTDSFPRIPVVGDFFEWDIWGEQSSLYFVELPPFTSAEIEEAKKKGAELRELFN
jgi:hypothetical protein